MAPRTRTARALMGKATLASVVSCRRAAGADLSTAARPAPPPPPHPPSSPKAVAHQPSQQGTPRRASSALQRSRATREALARLVHLRGGPNLPVDEGEAMAAR